MISIYEFFGFGEDDPNSVSSVLNEPPPQIDPKSMSPEVALSHLQQDTQNLLSKPDSEKTLNGWKLPFTDAREMNNRLQGNMQKMNDLDYLNNQYQRVVQGKEIEHPGIPTTMDKIKSHLPTFGVGLALGGLVAGGRGVRALNWMQDKYRQNKLNSNQNQDTSSLLRGYYRQ